jgi:hypothetical protein
MNIDKHRERLMESLEVLDESISKDIVKRQRTIGFNCSAASADMFEIYLHQNDLIDPGSVVKHEWLKSKNKIKEKFPFEFPNKKEILVLIEKIEEKRNDLCYGSPKKEEIIKEVILNFNKLKQLFQQMGVKIEK